MYIEYKFYGNYSYFNEEDMPNKGDDLCRIADFLGGDDSLPSAEEVWDFVRGQEAPPHLGNAFMILLVGNIENLLSERLGFDVRCDNKVSFDFVVAGSFSSLYLSGKKIKNFDEFLVWLKAFERHNKKQAKKKAQEAQFLM